MQFPCNVLNFKLKQVKLFCKKQAPCQNIVEHLCNFADDIVNDAMLSLRITNVMQIFIYSRINFKMALITHKAVHLDQPPSLRQHLTFQSYSTRTRSQNPLQLFRPFAKSFASKTFSHVAPTVWNCIPYNIRSASNVSSFRKQLKTYYF